jgi:hypothetical protein
MQQRGGPGIELQSRSATMPMQPEVDFGHNLWPSLSERELQWSPLVNWSVVQSKVVAMASDVLILIDACEAASAILHTDASSPGARNEIVAACPPNINTIRPPRGENTYRNRSGLTYTRVLAQMLTNKARSNREFTVAKLHFDVSNYLLNERYHEGQVGFLQIIPQYFVIPGTPRQPGISLRVLPRIVDGTSADGNDPLNSHQAHDDESLEDDDLIEGEVEAEEEEYSDPGEGPSQVHQTAVPECATNVNQVGGVHREDQYDREPTAPAATSQTHAPIQDELTPQEDRNLLDTGTVDTRATREDLLRLVSQLIETTQTPSYAKLKRRVKAHSREFQYHFDEEVGSGASIDSRRMKGRRPAEPNEELGS